MYNIEGPDNSSAEACVNMHVGGKGNGELPIFKELLDQSVANKM